MKTKITAVLAAVLIIEIIFISASIGSEENPDVQKQSKISDNISDNPPEDKKAENTAEKQNNPPNKKNNQTTEDEIQTSSEPDFWVYCDSCESCAKALKNEKSGTGIRLTKNITCENESCIDFDLIKNKTFDCRGNKIEGSVNSWSCIYMKNASNNRIENCVITGFVNGIYLLSSSKNNITGNTIKSNKEYGIYLDYRSNNNTISDNTAILNVRGICFARNSNNNTAKSNILCYNSRTYDIVNYASLNSGENNTCDTAEGWSDKDAINCANKCPQK